jgi:hypothetical protein
LLSALTAADDELSSCKTNDPAVFFLKKRTTTPQHDKEKKSCGESLIFSYCK